MIAVNRMTFWKLFVNVLDNKNGILDIAILQVNTDDHEMTLRCQLVVSSFKARLKCGACV